MRMSVSLCLSFSLSIYLSIYRSLSVTHNSTVKVDPTTSLPLCYERRTHTPSFTSFHLDPLSTHPQVYSPPPRHYLSTLHLSEPQINSHSTIHNLQSTLPLHPHYHFSYSNTHDFIPPPPPPPPPLLSLRQDTVKLLRPPSVSLS